MNLQIPVSAGELIDKITILEIKMERIDDAGKLSNVRRELQALRQVWQSIAPAPEGLDVMESELKRINETLWVIEDDIRECERRADFGDRFVELARLVYVTNDQRAAVKRAVNRLLGSELIEEKSYRDYGGARPNSDAGQ